MPAITRTAEPKVINGINVDDLFVLIDAVTHVLGAQAGPRRLETVLRSAGLSTIRKAAETPFNLVLEARL